MKITIPLIFSILGLCFISCGKDSPTVVNGTVVDKYTRMPIDSAFIEFQITHKPSADGSANIETRYIYSDKEGKFIFENSLPIRIFSIREAGYLIKGQVAVINGEVNDLTIEMIPTDGKLRLSLDNINAQFDTIFVGIYSPLLDSETPFSNGIVSSDAFAIPFGMSHIEDIDLAIDQSIIVYWSFSAATLSFGMAPNRDTIFIPKNQPIFHTISF